MSQSETGVTPGPEHRFGDAGARRSSGGQGMKVLCPPLNDINEVHKVALRNFLERSMSTELPFRYISLGII